VDGLHERAGARDVLRMHGSIWEVRCWNRCAAGRMNWRMDEVPLAQLPPACPHCGGLLRPGVVWFGEPLDPDVLHRCTAATRCDVFLTVGTSAVVYPAASLAGEARRRGAFTVEINLDDTPSSGAVDLSIRGRAEEVLSGIEEGLRA
jgi:NAD-dependent deacetylase